MLYGAKFKNITYGILLEKGIMCCLCKQNISRRNILNSLMFPLFWLGIVPFILGIIFKQPLVLLVAILNISGCIGDIAMFKFIFGLDQTTEFSEYDDPIGFALYSEHDLGETKSYGIEYVKTTDKIKKEDLQKIRISKFSIVILIILFVLSIVFII